MYNPPANRVDSVPAIHHLIERAGLGHVVGHGDDGFNASAVPLLLDRSAGELGALRGHVARANEQWKSLDGVDVLVVFPLLDGYVSPAWYPSKQNDPKVVPTWNYEIVHAHGVARITRERSWLLRLVTDLTDHHERRRTDDASTWRVDDAPAGFIDRQLAAIVGIEIEITRLDGKRKLSQNRSDADREGVIEGLQGRSQPDADMLADVMHTGQPVSDDLATAMAHIDQKFAAQRSDPIDGPQEMGLG